MSTFEIYRKSNNTKIENIFSYQVPVSLQEKREASLLPSLSFTRQFHFFFLLLIIDDSIKARECGDFAYNAKREIFALIPVHQQIHYHLFKIGMGDSKSSCSQFHLVRKTKWHPQMHQENGNSLSKLQNLKVDFNSKNYQL